MWRYQQSTGNLYNPAGEHVATGYAGYGEGKNNPALQHVPNVGPLPCGFYTFGAPYNSMKVGPFAIPLIADDTNTMFGRSAFRMHGDSVRNPGTASHGCCIQSRAIREACARSSDQRLEVFA